MHDQPLHNLITMHHIIRSIGSIKTGVWVFCFFFLLVVGLSKGWVSVIFVDICFKKKVFCFNFF